MVTLLISIDGMRPDGMMRADAPTLHRLARDGASTMTARTVMPSVTLPCHTSMVRGVDVPRHGITSNTFTPLARPVPSVFDVAAKAGLRVGFFYNWAELRDLCEPGSLAVSILHNHAHGPESDRKVASAAAQTITSESLDFAFVYLGWTDECGHLHGWMSEPYLQAIADADRCVEGLLGALESAQKPYRLILQSDHGGHDRSHGTEMPEDMTIPWVAYGEGFGSGRVLQDPVRIFDTCCTLAAAMQLPMAREWEGRVISEALAG